MQASNTAPVASAFRMLEIRIVQHVNRLVERVRIRTSHRQHGQVFAADRNRASRRIAARKRHLAKQVIDKLNVSRVHFHPVVLNDNWCLAVPHLLGRVSNLVSQAADEQGRLVGKLGRRTVPPYRVTPSRGTSTHWLSPLSRHPLSRYGDTAGPSGPAACKLITTASSPPTPPDRLNVSTMACPLKPLAS